MKKVLVMSVTAVLAASPPNPVPDFTGHWKLVTQETEAFHGRGAIGNHDEPVVITQTATRLSVAVQSPDPAGRFEYDLTGARLTSEARQGGSLWTVSHWEGTSLLSEGRRLFTTPKGSQPYDFAETRRLSADGTRMMVQTRIKMFPRDLVRTSEYKRID